MDLVVRLVTYVDGTFYAYGTGVVVGDDSSGTIWIVTARHVVMDAGQPVDSTEAFFYTACDQSFQAELCGRHQGGDDIALLCVSDPEGMAPRPPYNRLAPDGGATAVYAVGCPNGECWGVGQPDRVFLENEERVLFTTYSVAPGHSGGALFNDWFEVAGIIVAEGRPLSEAVPIRSALDLCVGDGGDCRRPPVRLGRPYTPRGGYGFSIGIIGPMFAIAPGEPSLGPQPDRIPSGRVTVLYQAGSHVEIHAGATRLTPDDLSLTAAIVGVGLTLGAWEERILLNPFVEGGFGHVEERYQADEYYVQTGGEPQLVPIWDRVESDGLGFGIGASLRLIIAPRVILEGVGGLWRFNRPEVPRTGFAAELPGGFFGFGLRIGG